MFTNLAGFSSFIESIIALSLVLGAWKKPKDFFCNVLSNKFFPNDITSVRESIDIANAFLLIVKFLLLLARFSSLLSVLYGLYLLFLIGLCAAPNICQNSELIFNHEMSIFAHLGLASITILLYIFAITIGLLYSLILLAYTWLSFVLKTSIKRFIKKQALVLISNMSEDELKELIKK